MAAWGKGRRRARSSARRSLRGRARQRPRGRSREHTAWLVASGRLVDGACIVKPLASMIWPGSVTRRFFLSPPPPLPRRVGGDHIEENGRRIFRRLPVLRQATDVIIRKIPPNRGQGHRLLWLGSIA